MEDWYVLVEGPRVNFLNEDLSNFDNITNESFLLVLVILERTHDLKSKVLVLISSISGHCDIGQFTNQ